eukprot:TRINITY_DN2935_c0_g1_i1.p1 TRINITY_DN2935_c0_g1~~TRINITY_DN2935_c0_g1_i1.p1  ORF type:complete len:162 (-),score=31.84 TRINITY_DN2935_c0_g1_i1:258-743(-)
MASTNSQQQTQYYVMQATPVNDSTQVYVTQPTVQAIVLPQQQQPQQQSLYSNTVVATPIYTTTQYNTVTTTQQQQSQQQPQYVYTNVTPVYVPQTVSTQQSAQAPVYVAQQQYQPSRVAVSQPYACQSCGACYNLPSGSESWRCKSCGKFNSISGKQCVML